MGEDITVTSALFSIVQRIEDKLDHVKDDLSTVKAKQAEIEANLHDHIESSSPANPQTQMSTAQSVILKYIIPIALALVMIGRASVAWIGNGASITSPKAPQHKELVVDPDSFTVRNERFDSILKAHLKKSVGGSGD